jgi:hypothetical protein
MRTSFLGPSTPMVIHCRRVTFRWIGTRGSLKTALRLRMNMVAPYTRVHRRYEVQKLADRAGGPTRPFRIEGCTLFGVRAKGERPLRKPVAMPERNAIQFRNAETPADREAPVRCKTERLRKSARGLTRPSSTRNICSATAHVI